MTTRRELFVISTGGADHRHPGSCVNLGWKVQIWQKHSQMSMSSPNGAGSKTVNMRVNRAVLSKKAIEEEHLRRAPDQL